jgi:hypothetical protein
MPARNDTMPEVYSVRRVGDAYWEVLAPEANSFEPPIRALAVLAEPCPAEFGGRAGDGSGSLAAD